MAEALAPTNLSPDDEIVPIPGEIVFTWDNHIITGEQLYTQIRTRLAGGSTWTNQQAQQTTEPEFVLGVDDALQVALEWQARIIVVDGETFAFSPWSETATFAMGPPPAAQVTSPTSGGTWDEGHLRLAWSYSSSSSLLQAAYRAWLETLNDAGTAWQTIEATGGWVYSTRDWHEFDHILEDGVQYRVNLRVMDEAGGTSTVSTVQFTASFDTPAVPEAVAEWDAQAGGVRVSVTNPTSVPGTAPAEHNRVTWSPLNPWEFSAGYQQIGTTEPNGDLLHRTPRLGATNRYAIRAVTDAGHYSQATFIQVDVPGGETIYLHWNRTTQDAWANTVELEYNPEVTISASRNRALHQYAGREHPTPTFGEHITRTIHLQARIVAGPPHDVAYLAEHPGPVLYRDPAGYRFVTSVDDAQVVHQRDTGTWQARLSLTVIDDTGVEHA